MDSDLRVSEEMGEKASVQYDQFQDALKRSLASSCAGYQSWGLDPAGDSFASSKEQLIVAGVGIASELRSSRSSDYHVMKSAALFFAVGRNVERG